MTLREQFPARGAQVLSSEDRIDLVCDDFEDQWRKGPPPALEEYLQRCDGADRRVMFCELLLVDLEQRKVRSDPPTFDEYLDRFPAYLQELESIWSRLERQETVALASTDTPTDRYRAGMRIAQFELRERLGSGGAGEVWKAYDTRLQRTVAVKLPCQRQVAGDELRRFLREGQAAARLRHSHLVSVHEVGHDGQTAFIVSDFIEGEDLRARLEHRHPTPRESAQLAADVAEALHHAHEHGIVHRDLKPANILMDRNDRAHVTDFGLAKWTDHERDMTVDGQILGTPAYMSPEQARGESHRVDRRTDVYALGTLLYELLTGRRPFDGDQATVMHHITSSEPARPRTIDKNIPRDLETVCLKALEKDPARRYPSAQELAVDLRRQLRGEPILARRISTLERSVRWIRRRPAVTSSIALALVAIGSLGLARMFAEENRQLLGLRTVTITTEPVGARVTFVPLDEVTEEPMPEKMVHARTPSPVVEELRPGNYLVVAVLGDGRFHEVLRRVPGKEENLPGAYAHLRWKLRLGAIELPAITIPERSVTDNMAYIQGTSRADSAEPSGPIPGVPGLYVDFGEMTVGSYRAVFRSDPPSRDGKVMPGAFAATTSFDHAVCVAERIGKRLPSAKEFESLVTRRGASRWPWGDAPPPEMVEDAFGPVGIPAFDRLLDDPRVVGLVSNVAEWTTSTIGDDQNRQESQHGESKSLPSTSALSDSLKNQLQSLRLVAGGDNFVVEGNATVAAEHRAPTARYGFSRAALRPGLGFRGVRSARPRDTVDAF